MKKLLLFASVLMIVASGCYKPKEKPKAADFMVLTAWKISNHLEYPIDSGASCHIAQLLVFNKDSTGYYYYPTPCDSTDTDTLKFRWYVSGDNKNVYYSNIGGNPAGKAVLGIAYYDHATLTLRGGLHYNRSLDGFFVAKN